MEEKNNNKKKIFIILKFTFIQFRFYSDHESISPATSLSHYYAYPSKLNAVNLKLDCFNVVV